MKKVLAIIVLAIITATILVGCENIPTSSDSTDSKGGLIVLKNDSFEDGTSTNQTGFAGMTMAKIGSFVIISDQDREVIQITLADYGPLSPMGSTFQNLLLKGQHYEVLSDIKDKLNASVGKYVFVLTTTIILRVGQKYTIGVYADIKGDASQIGVMHGVKFYSVTTTDETGTVEEYTKSFELQSLYIAPPQQKG